MNTDKLLKAVINPALVAAGITREELNNVIANGTDLEITRILFHAHHAVMVYLLDIIGRKDYSQYNRRDLKKAWPIAVDKVTLYWGKYVRELDEQERLYQEYRAKIRKDFGPIAQTEIE